ncbi:PEP/pyruvate-binding domain-containing protein [Glutamicibacter uratoxydans]|uniref:PEP/pyruvate-binding domain-containing protein n=1 Tax=Glutamicibacter uratoxydans TaxID=43667 RepID=UPI001142513B|nr:PEP/pyruvate-binding domain-containing protein [Glutamicibacter uratoxydans]
MILPDVVALSSAEAGSLAAVGGKAFGLNKLIKLGENVPQGFVVTTQAYRSALQQGAHRAVVGEELGRELREAYRKLESSLVAVRSSATAEDLPGAAFAGQQETYLGISSEDELIQAVEDCWASLYSERAQSYRQERRIDEADVSIAVVVQTMVDAEFAGVMFTADPIAGYRDRSVVESNLGLGEAVVSGMVTTDRAVIGEDGRIIERRTGQAGAVIRLKSDGGTVTEQGDGTLQLPESMLLEIARAGRRIQDGFGVPMDIEWAVCGEQLSILQARPMTALPPAPRKLNVLERKTAPMLFELMPLRPTILEAEAWIDSGINPLVRGMLAGITGVQVDYSASLQRVDGVITEFIPASPRPSLQTPGRLLSTLIWKAPEGTWNEDPLYKQYLQQCAELDNEDLRQLPFARLVSIPARACEAMQLVTQLRVKYLRPMIPAAAKMLAALALSGQLSKFSALSITNDTVTHRINRELQSIASAFNLVPGAVDLIGNSSGQQALELLHATEGMEELARLVDEFLSEYGHRETASLLLPKAPTWRADPTPVFDVIKLLAAGHAPGEQENHVLEQILESPVLRLPFIAPRVRRWAQLVQKFTSVREDTHFEITRTMPVFRSAIVEIGRRLHEAGGLEDPEDVWFLNYRQLLDATSLESLSTAVVAATAAGRRRRNQELAAAPMISPATLYDLSPVPGALLHGTGSGGGQAVGTVRIINSPAEFDKLLPGEILVCPATNPSWTPLFARASAVVVDHGSAASHAAIVAREYRIPAVMGCANATTTLRDGQKIRVDGDRGLVFEASDASDA